MREEAVMGERVAATASVPDVLGLRKEEAVHLLAGQGVPILETRVTEPNSAFRLLDRWRVIQQRIQKGGVILVVAREMAPED